VRVAVVGGIDGNLAMSSLDPDEIRRLFEDQRSVPSGA